MIYYESRELAQLLDINLARWKRWAREFLPPDPIGGLQSGYARQFNLKSAFRVFLGGQLVSALKFSIPEALKILDDLEGWLKANRFYTFHSRNPNLDPPGGDCRIYIFGISNNRFGYVIQHRITKPPKGEPGPLPAAEPGNRTLLHTDTDPIEDGTAMVARVIGLSALHRRFLERVDHL